MYIYERFIGGDYTIFLKQFTSDGSHFSGHDPVEGPKGVRLDDLQVVIADFNGNG